MVNKIKKQSRILFTLLSAMLLSMSLKASHIAGGEITYTCLGGNQFQINLNLFVDCAGFNPGASQTINFVSTCGGTATATVNVSSATTNGLEISQLCSPQLPNSTCNGGTLPGMWLFSYTGVVTLAPPCDTWTMSWSTCCRNLAITNLSSASSNYYIAATLNSATAPCNSSPQFTAQPIPYVCVGQPVNYSYGVVETDGDSLYYQLISALDGAGVNSTYNAGYSGTSPIPGITINPNTGLLTFTPGTIGNFVVVVLVTEYDSNGNVVGTVMRDIQFVVQSCTNQVPNPSAGAITGFSGSAVQTGPFAIELCAGNNFSFSATFTDPNPGDVLTYVSNISAALPGATITSSGTNPLTLNISWNAPAGTQGQNLTFTVTVQDGACPIQGQQTFVYSVGILDATTTNPDITICGAQTAQLNAYGGSTFTWSVVSGSPMAVGTNFSCNPCANPVATPAVTTTYAVISDLSGSCDNVDTVTVFVVPNFTYNITQSSTSSCLLQPIQLGVANLTPAGPGYTYSWAPATYLSATNIQNPVATITTPGTYTYTVTVTSPQGCVKTDQVTISVVPAVSPVITAHNDTTFCAGSTAALIVTFGNGIPATCGPSATGGCAVSTPVQVGTGTIATTYPTPFPGFWNNGRMQLLYTAAELNTLGFVGGKITSLTLNVTTKASTQPYNGFTIKMGCTNLSSLPSASFQVVPTVVFGPIAVTTTAGLNTYNFTTVYEWDGISNLIVEICYNNTSWTSNDVVAKTTTTFASVVTAWQDPNPGCTYPTPSTGYSQFERPNVRFGTCAVAANPANYSYLWAPASGNIANATTQNTTAQPITTTTFTVTVTDIAGGCSSTDSVLVNVINVNALSITPAGPFCVNGPTATLAVNVPMSYGTWSGPGVNPTTGVFNPATAGAGTHQIIFAVNGTCGTGADTISIVVTPQPDATINPVPNQCSSGTPIALSAATPGGTWSGTGITNTTTGIFNPAVAGAGTHTITYSLTTPCTSSATTTIVVTNQLDATITHVGPFCSANPAITLSAVDGGGTWSGTGITNTATGVFDPATAGPGNHVITYTITGLCGNTDTDTIQVMASPVISFTSDTTQGCEPTTINFISTTNQPGGRCSWTFGDGNTSTNCNPSNTYVYAGNYNVTFTYSNAIGCTSTITQPNYITIHSQPVAAFIATPQPTTIVDPEVHFLDYSTGVIDTWLWNFGMIGSSSQQNPIYVFPDTGSYPVQLIVTNTHGCADTAIRNIIIDQIVLFYAPNAFTPNSNGLNDQFRVYGDGIDKSTFEMRIFNRWGEMIFKSNDYYVGWNGAKNNTGALVQQDVYVWKVTFKDFTGKKQEHYGHVTLVK
jgi:gliding motility-associated-like protein